MKIPALNVLEKVDLLCYDDNFHNAVIELHKVVKNRKAAIHGDLTLYYIRLYRALLQSNHIELSMKAFESAKQCFSKLSKCSSLFKQSRAEFEFACLQDLHEKIPGLPEERENPPPSNTKEAEPLPATEGVDAVKIVDPEEKPAEQEEEHTEDLVPVVSGEEQPAPNLEEQDIPKEVLEQYQNDMNAQLKKCAAAFLEYNDPTVQLLNFHYIAGKHLMSLGQYPEAYSEFACASSTCDEIMEDAKVHFFETKKLEDNLKGKDSETVEILRRGYGSLYIKLQAQANVIDSHIVYCGNNMDDEEFTGDTEDDECEETEGELTEDHQDQEQIAEVAEKAD